MPRKRTTAHPPKVDWPGCYVYELVDSRDGSVFYVGKGQGQRVRQHAAECRADNHSNGFLQMRVHAIWDAGGRVIEQCVQSGLTEGSALALERQTIALHGIRNLTNQLPGQHNWQARQILLARTMLRSAGARDHFVATSAPVARPWMALLWDELAEMAQGRRLAPDVAIIREGHEGMAALHALCNPGLAPLEGLTHAE